MASRLDKWAQYEIKENVAVKAFLNALHKQKEAVADDELTRRSWAKPDGSGFVVQLGRLNKSYRIAKRDDVIALFDDVATAAREDEDFIGDIEAAYGTPLGEEPAVKKPRKPRTPKAAAVDTDIVTSIPLRPRS